MANSELTYLWNRCQGHWTRARCPAGPRLGSRGSDRCSPWVRHRMAGRSRSRSPVGCGTALRCSSTAQPLPHLHTEKYQNIYMYIYTLFFITMYNNICSVLSPGKAALLSHVCPTLPDLLDTQTTWGWPVSSCNSLRFCAHTQDRQYLQLFHRLQCVYF